MNFRIILAICALTLALLLVGCSGLDSQSTALDYYNAGVKLQEQGRLNESLAQYDAATQLDDQSAAAFYNRGTAFQGLGEFQSAINDYDKALELDPDLLLWL